MDVVILLAIFILCLFLMETFRYAYTNIRKPELKAVRKRLKKLPSTAYEHGSIDILRRRQYSDIPWLHALLGRLHGLKKLDTQLIQANIDFSLGFFLLLSPLLAMCGFYLIKSALQGGLIIPLLAAIAFGYLPFLYIRLKKTERMRKFERQLPDALELVARSLRAGQAFSGGLAVVSEEFDDPLGTEFERTLDEIKFGVGIPEALKNLASRVDCPDLRFFVVSVIIQRESGGNLAEIIDSIAYVIRERFKLLGKIRILSAEGKFSAIVLCSLPFLMALAIYLLNRDYLMVLVEDPIGKTMMAAALIMMFLGVIVMRRMIQIKV